ncbi:hypothetical protein PIB30_105073, partial [Stylosanthes scabra]|nr:hypothetical protein [Stylosanthes scabra]
MDLDMIECVSSSDFMDENEIQHHNLQPHHHNEFSSLKPRKGDANNNSNNNVMDATTTIIPPATNVHDFLKYPVCTNSMYPSIHQ